MLRRLWTAFIAGPSYLATAGDRRTIPLFGLDLPVRASIATIVVTLVVLFDYSRTFIPDEIQALGRQAEALRFQALERVVLFLLVPVLVAWLAFRDRPQNYGLRLGEWRWGVPLAIVGCAVMTPIVLLLGTQPDFRSFYAISGASPDYLTVTHTFDLVSTEFVFRGFFMFTLLRAIGPLGLLVAQLPFVFAHFGKPEIELFSTLFGGAVYGWLDWRTGSIWYSAAAHVYILTLVVLVASS